MKRLANITLLVVATSLCVLACETPVPESFEGNTDTPAKVGKSNKEDKSKSKLEESKADPKPSPAGSSSTTPAPTTPAKPPEAPVPACSDKASWESCLTCCDAGGAYPPFLAKLKGCNGEATCEKAARDACFADKACSAADKCLLPNGCWNKKTDAEIAEEANPPAADP